MALNTSISPFSEYFDVATDEIIANAPGMTSQCWNWCKEQHFANQSNLTIEGISIIAIALIVLFIYNLLIKYLENVEIEGMDKTKVKKYIALMPEFVIYLLIGFFVWFVWFS